MNKTYNIIFLLVILINGCGYPDIDNVPHETELNITHQDRVNIKKLKKEFDE